MIRPLVPALLFTAALLSAPPHAQTFTPLFNGTSLAGWKTQGQGVWEVKDGVIQGTGQTSNPKNTWLISERADYRDFDFRFRFMGVSGNSGLNFRSAQGAEDVTGVQVDIDNGRTTGGLYEVIVRNGQYAGAYLTQPPASQIGGLQKSADWNLVELKVRDRQVEVWLNGTRVVNHPLTRVEPQGFFAFQLHDKAVTRISLKDIEISEVGVTSIRMPPRLEAWESRRHAGSSGLRAWNPAGRQVIAGLGEDAAKPLGRGMPYFLAP